MVVPSRLREKGNLSATGGEGLFHAKYASVVPNCIDLGGLDNSLSR